MFGQDDDEDDDDSEISDFDIDETTLETYLTPIDDEEADNPIDEYIAFQQTLTCTYHCIAMISFLLVGKIVEVLMRILCISNFYSRCPQYLKPKIHNITGY